MKKAGVDFQDFMAEFIRANGSTQRKYSQRVKFDVARYEEARRIQRPCVSGTRLDSGFSL